jgi:phosphoribosylformimino-5-aminoimidazole carboxamide ribotide isomerase
VRIIPAIDLQGGKCVRLYKGDFARVTEYSDNPVSIAEEFSALQVRDLHIVDLDGARTGAQQNQAIVADLCAATDLSVQLGGGIRNATTVADWMQRGVDRCVIGSLAVTEPELVAEWFAEFGAGRIVIALDVSIDETGPVVVTHGWTKSSGSSLWDCIDGLADAGMEHLLCTDISRDGAMAGPNFELYADLVRRFPQLLLQASGGVRDAADLAALRNLGIPAAITGKALLDGRISAAEVASFQQSE